MTKIKHKNSLLSLLNILNEKNSKKPTKTDFLLSFLKEIKDKKLIKELIINSNLDKNTKEKLLKFFNIENNIEIKNSKQIKIKKISKNNFQHNENKQIINTNLKKDKTIPLINKITNKDKTDVTIQNNSLLEMLLSQTPISENLITKIENEIKIKPQNTQKEIVKEIKTLIIMKKDNPIIKKIIISKEFKEAKNFKDILNLSKKFELNLLKVAVSQIKQHPKIIQTHKILNNHTSQIFTNKLKNSIQKPINPVNNDLNPKKSIINELFKPQKISKDIKPKQDKNSHKEDIAPQINISDIKPKIIEAKQTIKHFATSLKEAVENYKPPITKLTLELHPREIGKVEVIIKQRGDNLQIQLNTNNQNTVNFFIQNQNELKNSLVNMGFTNINMNFNSNDQNKKQNNQKPQYSISKTEDEEELVIDFTYKYA